MSNCPICNGSGLLPFKKGGKVIPNTLLDCSCKHEVEHYSHDVEFDFPCSDTFRGFSYEISGRPDPYRDSSPQTPERRPYIPRPVINVTYQIDGVNTPAFKDMREEIQHLRGRLNKYFEKKVPKVKSSGIEE